jgi:hypothetical protein
MQNYFFNPASPDIVDSEQSVSGNKSDKTDKTLISISTQTEDKQDNYTFLYNIPFFSSLFFPNILNKSTLVQNNKTYKTLFYYQTFSSLDPIINLKRKTKEDIYVYISSVHFGISNKIPYIGINNNSIENQGTLWDDAIKAHENDINIMLMIGGAGGAYTALFSDFETYYSLLYILLNERRYIVGVDLDIEESVKLDDVKKLITRLNKDFGSTFIITMAPVASSMMYDMPGMCDFIYKDLYNSPEGEYISWYNVQSYNEYTFDIYNSIVQNGYTPNNIVFGLLGNNFNSMSMLNVSNELNKIKTKYPTMAGVIMWEYGDTTINPIEWAISI